MYFFDGKGKMLTAPAGCDIFYLLFLYGKRADTIEKK